MQLANGLPKMSGEALVLRFCPLNHIKNGFVWSEGTHFPPQAPPTFVITNLFLPINRRLVSTTNK